MAHISQTEWCMKLKNDYPKYFVNKRVLDIGSLDINGNNKSLFVNCDYVGLDVVKGKNVDVVSIAHEYNPDKLFDVVLSTSALEHDMYYKLTLRKMVALLKPKGFMFISAPYEWHEHGTKKSRPEHSGTTQMGEKWANYYKNIDIEDITGTLNLEEIFYEFYIGVSSHKAIKGRDFRFWGIKK